MTAVSVLIIVGSLIATFLHLAAHRSGRSPESESRIGSIASGPMFLKYVPVSCRTIRGVRTWVTLDGTVLFWR